MQYERKTSSCPLFSPKALQCVVQLDSCQWWPEVLDPIIQWLMAQMTWRWLNHKIYEHHEHTMDHGIMRNANGMLMCSSSSVSEMYLQHSKWKEQMYLILWGYGYLNWGPLSILKDKGNGHYVCQQIVEDGLCLVEREKERSHKRVNFYSSESRIELH